MIRVYDMEVRSVLVCVCMYMCMHGVRASTESILLRC